MAAAQMALTALQMLACSCLAHTEAKPCLGVDPQPGVEREVPVAVVKYVREERQQASFDRRDSGAQNADLSDVTAVSGFLCALHSQVTLCGGG